MIRDVALGQYIPGNGIVHRTDPRVKILLLIAFIVFIFCSFSFVSLGIVTAAVAVIMMIIPITIFIFCQSNIIETMVSSGIKE